MLAATKYEPSSFRTYVTKGFLARWIVVLNSDLYQVRNFELIDWDELKIVMSQHRSSGKAAVAAIATESSWRDAIASLLHQGIEHGYSLAGRELNLLGRIRTESKK